jgi:hypothetical protein
MISVAETHADDAAGDAGVRRPWVAPKVDIQPVEDAEGSFAVDLDSSTVS